MASEIYIKPEPCPESPDASAGIEHSPNEAESRMETEFVNIKIEPTIPISIKQEPPDCLDCPVELEPPKYGENEQTTIQAQAPAKIYVKNEPTEQIDVQVSGPTENITIKVEPADPDDVSYVSQADYYCVNKPGERKKQLDFSDLEKKKEFKYEKVHYVNENNSNFEVGVNFKSDSDESLHLNPIKSRKVLPEKSLVVPNPIPIEKTMKEEDLYDLSTTPSMKNTDKTHDDKLNHALQKDIDVNNQTFKFEEACTSVINQNKILDETAKVQSDLNASNDSLLRERDALPIEQYIDAVDVRNNFILESSEESSYNSESESGFVSEVTSTSESDSDDTSEREDLVDTGDDNANASSKTDDSQWQDITEYNQNFDDFSGKYKVNFSIDDKTPEDCYKFIQNNKEKIKLKSRVKAWKSTNPEEMRSFFGILLVMGMVRVPHINEYWSKKMLYRNKFISSVMTRDRFLILLMFCHFSDVSTDTNGDKLYKIREIFDMLVSRFRIAVTPGKYVVVDESTIPWRGTLKLRYYADYKSQNYGVKLTKLYTPEGYTSNVLIHTGIAKQDTALKLIKDFDNSGRVVIANHLFNSVNLAEELIKEKTFICGTLRQKTKGLPRNVTSMKMKKGQVVGKMNGKGVKVIKWEDKKSILMISTCDGHVAKISNIGRKGLGKDEIKKPLCVK